MIAVLVKFHRGLSLPKARRSDVNMMSTIESAGKQVRSTPKIKAGPAKSQQLPLSQHSSVWMATLEVVLPRSATCLECITFTALPYLSRTLTSRYDTAIKNM